MDALFAGIEDDLGDLGPLVRDELVRGVHAETYLAKQRQQAIADANQRIEAACVEGLGQKMMSVDLSFWHFWNQKEPGCWADKDFRRRMARDNPELRVKSAPTKCRVQVDGFRDRRPSPVNGGLVLA